MTYTNIIKDILTNYKYNGLCTEKRLKYTRPGISNR